MLQTRPMAKERICTRTAVLIKGEGQEDLKHGRGIETWLDGSTFEGQYLSGKKHDHGVYQAADHLDSMSRADGFAIAQHTCIEANLRSGRSCDKQLIRATSALYRVMSPPVSAWLSLASSPAICGRSRSCLSAAVHVDSLPCFHHFLRRPHPSCPQHTESQCDWLVPIRCL